MSERSCSSRGCLPVARLGLQFLRRQKQPDQAPVTTVPFATTTLVPCGPFDPGPPFPQPSAQLAPLLFTLADLPADYGSIPSSIAGTLAEFNAAVPSNLPYNFVEYYYPWSPNSADGPTYFGLEVSEALGEAPSAQTAQTMADNLNSVNNRCHPGTQLDLPGTEPNVVASESSGATYSSVIAYAIKGPYVVQLTWANAPPPPTGNTSPPGAPTVPYSQLPTAAEMASIVNATLAHLPA
jgi:hypothetical protein